MSFYYRPSLITVSSSGYKNGADLILSDHGRSPLQIDTERIENRERMSSGRMRSKHIADKYTFSTDWEMLPSRSKVGTNNVVADGYASASDLSEFYLATKGAFILKIYADAGVGATLTPSSLFGTYSVFFEDFSMELSKRGKDFDFYDVSITLEEA